MDRTRVLCPSISFAAHALGAAMLLVAPLLTADRLPLPQGGGDFVALAVARSTIAHLGGPPAGGGTRRPVPVRVEPRPTRTLPTSFAATVPGPEPIDLAGPGVPGPEGLPTGSGTGGVCLVNCGDGQGDGVVGVDAVLPRAEEKPAPQRAGRGGFLQEPRKVRNVAPVYPPLAVAVHLQGRVVLDCVIDENGRIASVTVLSGNPLLDRAAIEAVRQWRYTPTLLNGVRVSVLLTVTVNFTLR